MKMLKDWKFLLGVGLSLLFIWLAFRKVDFHQMMQAFTEANYWWLIPTVILSFIAHGLRTLRWRYLLDPIERVPLRPLFNALMIGYLFNVFLPAHLGEFIRAYLLGKKRSLSSSVVFGTIVMERIIDVAALFLCMALAVLVFPFPDWVRMGGYITFAGIAALFAVLILMKKYPKLALALVDRLFNPVAPHLAVKLKNLTESFLRGIVPLARPSDYLVVTVLSVLIWVCYGYGFQLVLYSFNFVATYSLPWTTSLVLLVITTFGVLVPSSPGYVGTYHWLCQQSLALPAFNVPESPALTFAIVMHAINFVPILVVGLTLLASEGLSFKGLQAKAHLQESGETEKSA